MAIEWKGSAGCYYANEGVHGNAMNYIVAKSASRSGGWRLRATGPYERKYEVHLGWFKTFALAKAFAELDLKREQSKKWIPGRPS